MTEIKKGFSAYPEINALARRAFPTSNVSVQAAITGDDYNILIDGKAIITGTTEEVRKRLNQTLVLLDRQP